jgi:hypothetical protein
MVKVGCRAWRFVFDGLGEHISWCLCAACPIDVERPSLDTGIVVGGVPRKIVINQEGLRADFVETWVGGFYCRQKVTVLNFDSEFQRCLPACQSSKDCGQ